MRNQCLRLIFIRSCSAFLPAVSQVHHPCSFASSFLRPRTPHAIPRPFILRHAFSSTPELSSVETPTPLSNQATLLVDIFSTPEKSNDEIKLNLDSKNVSIDHDLILSVLRSPEISLDVARRIFSWVLENQSDKLSSKSYNLMLKNLAETGLVTETWDMIGSMKKRGYGVSKGAYVKISEKFQNDGLHSDVEKLKDLYASGSGSSKKYDGCEENDIRNASSTITKIIREGVWGDDVEKQLKELNVKFSSDLVSKVLGNLEMEPNKALILFRWVQETGLLKHDEQLFNAMARVLGKEDRSQKLWRFLNEMRSEGREMERETYIKILLQFFKKKMIRDATDLYEFAMLGENKPSVQDCILLLKKIVVCKELDMDLFLKVLRIFKAAGNVFTDANLDSVMKSLISVGRMTECNRILAAVGEEAGYTPSASSRCKVAFKLSKGGKTGEALEFMSNTAASTNDSNHATWISLVRGYCVARDLDGASNSVRKMIKEVGASCAGLALNMLVDAYCCKNKPLDAYKFVVEMVNDEGLNISHTRYKMLTSKLLSKRYFSEALDVIVMMKNEGYPPDLDSFVRYLSRTGSPEEAYTFSLFLTSKRLPATSFFLRLFEAYFKAGRRNEAQDFLSKCPTNIKNHADVLNLFHSRKSGLTRATTAAVAV